VALHEALGFRRQQGGGALAFVSDGERTLALAKADVVALANGTGTVSSEASGVVLAFLTRTRPEVDETLAQAVAAGGNVVGAADEGAWGGYGASFADRDGHVWAVIRDPGLHRG
jgi:hypothetical protein